jgi:hypothetical protein
MFALAVLVLVSLFASTSVATQGRHIDVLSYSWGVTQTANLVVCINGSPRSAGNRWPTEEMASALVRIANQPGDVVLERQLRAPAGGFQCSEVPYAELLAAGLPPDARAGALTFRVDILLPAGSSKTGLSGAVMNVDALTGKIEMHTAMKVFMDVVTNQSVPVVP